MYLLPLFKSLMQKVCSHMTEREGAMFVCVCVCVHTGGAYMHTVWRNGSPCAVILKQRFPQQPHAPLVPL